jgi:hypothetical protein
MGFISTVRGAATERVQHGPLASHSGQRSVTVSCRWAIYACTAFVLGASAVASGPQGGVAERLRSVTDNYAAGCISGLGLAGEKYDRRLELVSIGREISVTATSLSQGDRAHVRADLERGVHASVLLRDQPLTAELLAVLGEMNLPRLDALCSSSFREQPMLVAGALAAKARVRGITDEYERLFRAVSDLSDAAGWSDTRTEIEVRRLLADLFQARRIRDELAQSSGVERQFEIVLATAVSGAMLQGQLSTKPWIAGAASASAARKVLKQLSVVEPSRIARLLHDAPPGLFFPGANMVEDDPALAREFADRVRSCMLSHLSTACREAYSQL